MDSKVTDGNMGTQERSADQIAQAFLEDAVATFSSKPAAATRAIRQLQNHDPSGFALAAVRMLTANPEKSPGVQFVASLLFTGSLLIEVLLDEEALPLGAAINLARNMSGIEHALDARLIQKLLANASGEVRDIKGSAAVRVLRLLEAISDCARLSSYLIQLLRHPDSEVRSKTALLLGRANLNLSRVKSLLGSGDARLRANAVESLWGHDSTAVKAVLWEAVTDSSRASMNALLALCRQGDPQAFERVRREAAAEDQVDRRRAAWAMGEVGDPKFAADLDRLLEDHDATVRETAQKSRAKLRSSEPEPPPKDEKPAESAPELASEAAPEPATAA